jgi:hypothetical protein
VSHISSWSLSSDPGVQLRGSSSSVPVSRVVGVLEHRLPRRLAAAKESVNPLALDEFVELSVVSKEPIQVN